MREDLLSDGSKRENLTSSLFVHSFFFLFLKEDTWYKKEVPTKYIQERFFQVVNSTKRN